MSKNLDQVYIANPITSNASTDLMYFMQSPYSVGTDAGMTYANFSAQFGNPYTPSALTNTNDTNVTLTLGGSPTTALLHATSMTLGWTGTLSGARGGTGIANTGQTINLGSFTTGYVLTSDSSGNASWAATAAPASAALTEVNDTNVTLTLGGSPTTALLHATSITAGWTGTLAITRGGTGVGSVTIAPTSLAFAGWDTNLNLSTNNLIYGYATTATAAGTTTLTASSSYLQYFTGSTTQTVVLPVASTLVDGFAFKIVNNSTGNVTIQSSGLNTVQVMVASSAAIVTCIANSGTTAASWSVEYTINADLSGAVLLNPGANQTINGNYLFSVFNSAANNYIPSTTTTSITGGTATLTNTSTQIQNLTGTGGSLVLPDATTLAIGWPFVINNNSSGTITVKTNGGATLFTMASGGVASVNALTIGTSAGTWNYEFSIPENGSWGTAGLSVTGTIAATGNISAGTATGTGASVISYPNITNRGLLQLSATPNSANTPTTITNAPMSQASTITIPDPASPTADFCIAPDGLVSGNLVVASGNIGLLTDAGYAPSQGFTINNQNSSAVTLSPFTINLTNNGATLVTYTLPSFSQQGDTFIIIGASTGGWKVATAGGSQAFEISPSTATTAIASTQPYDSVMFTYAGTFSSIQRFICYAVQGNLTIT